MSIKAVASSDTPVNEAQVLIDRLIKSWQEHSPASQSRSIKKRGIVGEVGVMNLLDPDDEDWCLNKASPSSTS